MSWLLQCHFFILALNLDPWNSEISPNGGKWSVIWWILWRTANLRHNSGCWNPFKQSRPARITVCILHHAWFAPVGIIHRLDPLSDVSCHQCHLNPMQSGIVKIYICLLAAPFNFWWLGLHFCQSRMKTLDSNGNWSKDWLKPQNPSLHITVRERVLERRDLNKRILAYTIIHLV